MDLLIWGHTYSIGNDLVDNQHKKLMELINTLHRIESGESDEDINDVLNELVNYTVYHFKSEEELQQKEYIRDEGWGLPRDVHSRCRGNGPGRPGARRGSRGRLEIADQPAGGMEADFCGRLAYAPELLLRPEYARAGLDCGQNPLRANARTRDRPQGTE